MSSTTFRKLFEPGRIGPLELRNRLIMTAMGNNLIENNTVNNRLIAYYEERAKGGVAMIVVGGAQINDGLARSGHLLLSLGEDRYLPGLRDLSSAIRRHGAIAGIQIIHAGSRADTTLQAVSASAIVGLNKQVTHELTVDEILAVEQEFAQAAVRAREVGYQAVELNCCSGYLIREFLSPRTNTRQDHYGGSLENRTRFLLEVIAAIQKAAGPDLAVMCRLTGDEFLPGGNGLEEAIGIAKACAAANVAAIDVTVGGHETNTPLTPGMVPPAAYAYYAQQVKRAVDVPVIYGTRVNSAQTAERVLRDGQADFIGMVRALNADPYLPIKAAEGRVDEIVPCVACHQGCYDQLFSNLPVFCLANPQTAFELERRVEPAERKKRVAVVGGGPGGMEAAIVAAQRGHDVTLLERGERLGGQFEVLSAPPGKQDFRLLGEYMQRELQRQGVKVLLNTEASREAIAALRPDAVIVATGSSPMALPVAGANLPSVASAHQVLAGEVDLGARVVIVGGNAVGIETAIYCARRGAPEPATAAYLATYGSWDAKTAVERTMRGREVTVLEMMGKAGGDLGRTTRWATMMAARSAGVNVITGAKVVAIEPGVVVFEQEGETKRLRADNVITAVGARSNGELAGQLEGMGVEVHVVGDAARPRKAMDAIREGFLVGLTI